MNEVFKENDIHVFKNQVGELTKYRGHENSVGVINLITNDCFISGSSDKTVKFWQTKYRSK